MSTQTHIVTLGTTSHRVPFSTLNFSNSKKYFLYLIFQRSTILILISDYCARQLLSIQPDFETQKCAIEELIASNRNFLPHKFYCELNYIEQF